MLFPSYTFFIFFAVVLLISRWISHWSIRKSFLLLVSYIFYAVWNPPFVLLLVFSTVADWFLAKAMHRTANQSRRKLLLILSLLTNLGLLGNFKYGNFILDNFVAWMNTLGIAYHPAAMNIILPVGISFYTFQTLSYTFDVYRRELKPANSFLDYALYVTFFPQLVAGPIVRARDFLPQCITPKQATRQQIGWGLSLFILGLFYKVILADSLMSGPVDEIFNNSSAVTFWDGWIGAMAFAMQIYGDFAGYSLCAIGIALCLGFELPDNFRFPYAAVGFSDFWQRWHISLSTWLRDYLYIALGGNRHSLFNTYRNLMITMLLGGLWHGASWMFVIWGGLHGLYLVAERLVRQQAWSRAHFWQQPIMQFILALVTFAFVCVAWVFFRAQSLEHALALVTAMVSPWSSSPLVLSSKVIQRDEFVIVLAFTAAILGFEWYMRDKSFEAVASRLPLWCLSLLLTVMTLLIFVSMGGGERAFIYFQF